MFVYDGDSYQSPLLASLSGNTLPQPIEAKSGKVFDEELVKETKYFKFMEDINCACFFHISFSDASSSLQ